MLRSPQSALSQRKLATTYRIELRLVGQNAYLIHLEVQNGWDKYHTLEAIFDYNESFYGVVSREVARSSVAQSNNVPNHWAARLLCRRLKGVSLKSGRNLLRSQPLIGIRCAIVHEHSRSVHQELDKLGPHCGQDSNMHFQCNYL